MVLLPETPVCAAMTTLRPMVTLWPDVDEVVELGAAADARLFERAAIDRGVRADLHIIFDDEPALLRELRVLAGRAVAHVAEAIGAEHCARMHDHAISQFRAGIEHHARIKVAIAADAHAGADDDAGIDAGACADDRVSLR